MFSQLLKRDVGPLIDKISIVFVLFDDPVSHGQCHGAVRARKRRKPFVTVTRRIGEPYIKRDHLSPVLKTPILDSIGKRNMPLMCFKCI